MQDYSDRHVHMYQYSGMYFDITYTHMYVTDVYIEYTTDSFFTTGLE